MFRVHGPEDGPGADYECCEREPADEVVHHLPLVFGGALRRTLSLTRFDLSALRDLRPPLRGESLPVATPLKIAMLERNIVL